MAVVVEQAAPTTLCRDCGWLSGTSQTADAPADRCPKCRGHRLLSHSEIASLSIAHIDCDAFYASVEKRDNPDLRDKPVIVGGGHRGVVSAACYVARLYGVRSAMPMFKALRACPDAVVIRPDMNKYRSVGRQIRELMEELTPLVEPLSIDEAFLDLTGTERLHGGPPARSLALLIKRIEERFSLTASVGLSYNKFLAKVASDLDKPRGFAVIGKAEAKRFLADKPVGMIWGVGKALQATLARDGIANIKDLLAYEEAVLVGRYGAIGRRLYSFSRGEDQRKVTPDSPTKSISAETTFDEDIGDLALLRGHLWPLCEKVARRLKAQGLAGGTVVLKLKTGSFKLITRSHRLDGSTRLAEVLYREALYILTKECDGRVFRLIGVGVSELEPLSHADQGSLIDPDRPRLIRLEDALDRLRDKLGPDAIAKGRGFKPMPPRKPLKKSE